MRKTFLLIITTLCLSVLLVACGSNNEDTTNGQDQNETVEITDEEVLNDDVVVATVNGTEITGKEYNSVYIRTKLLLYQYRQDIEDLDLLKEQALNILIDEELLRQDADKAGITVSEEEVQEQFSDIKKEVSEEEFVAHLEQNQLSEKEYKKELSNSILLDKYFESEIPTIEVTEEEITELYEERRNAREDYPDFKEIEEQLKLELISQKEHDELQVKINELRDEAEIEEKI